MQPTPPVETRRKLKLPEIASSRTEQRGVIASDVGAAVAPSSRKLLKLQINGIKRVKRNVARRREDKDDRRRMIDLDVAHSFQVEKMEAYKTSVLSQARALVTTKEEERALSHMPADAMEAALNVSKKVSDVKRLGREQIQSRRGYDRSRDKAGMLSERSDKGQGWGKIEKYEPMSARIARSQGWDSRKIPDQVASKLKYTLSFVNGMERTHGRSNRALELVRRELDENGDPHAQPPGMVNSKISRDQQERVQREINQRRNMSRIRQNLKSFHANGEGDGTVADAMLLHDSYLEWKLDSRPARPDVEVEESPRCRRVVTDSDSQPRKPEKPWPAAGGHLHLPKPPTPRTEMARSIAVEVGVKVKSAKAGLNKKIEDEPFWGKQTRRTMKSMGITDGNALRNVIAAKFGEVQGPTV